MKKIFVISFASVAGCFAFCGNVDINTETHTGGITSDADINVNGSTPRPSSPYDLVLISGDVSAAGDMNVYRPTSLTDGDLSVLGSVNLNGNTINVNDNVEATSISDGTVYTYWPNLNLSLPPNSQSDIINIANVSFDASVTANDPASLSGNVDFKHGPTQNFQDIVLDNADVRNLTWDPMTINAKTVSIAANGGGICQSELDEIHLNASGGLVLRVNSTDSYSQLSFVNGATLDMNGGTISIYFDDSLGGEHLGFDLFKGLQEGTITNIGGIKLYGATSDYSDQEIIDAILNGTFSDSTITFNILAPHAASAPLQTSFMARENMALMTASQFDILYRIGTNKSMFRSMRIATLDNPPHDKLSASNGMSGYSPISYESAPVFGVRSLNRFGSSGGDDWHQSFGAQLTVDYEVKPGIFAGATIGGFASEVGGKEYSAKSDNILMNAYTNANIAGSLDAFVILGYSHGFCDGKRYEGASTYNSDWDSNILGGIAGVRYDVALLDDESLVITPTAGVAMAYLWNTSANETGGANSMYITSESYASLKPLVGAEISYKLTDNLFITARGYYTYEMLDSSYDVSAALTGGILETYSGKNYERTSVITGAGLNYQICESAYFYADYSAEICAGEISNNINAGLQIRF